MQVALLEWYRKSELSCDRAGLARHAGRAGVPRPRISSSPAARAGDDTIDLDEFSLQAKEYETSGGAWDRRSSSSTPCSATIRSTPCAPPSCSAGPRSDDYARILRGEYPRRGRRGRPATRATITRRPPATTEIAHAPRWARSKARSAGRAMRSGRRFARARAVRQRDRRRQHGRRTQRRRTPPREGTDRRRRRPRARAGVEVQAGRSGH